MTSSEEIKTVVTEEITDRRLEVLSDTMGLSSYEVRMRAGVTPNENAPTGAARVPRPRRSHRGGRGYPERTDRDFELEAIREYVPTEEELARVAGPDDPGWQEAHALVDGIAEEAVAKRAIEAGNGHILPAIQRARAEKRAKLQGKPLN